MFGHVKLLSWEQVKITTPLCILLRSYHEYTKIVNKISISVRKASVLKLYLLGDSTRRRYDLSSGRPSGRLLLFYGLSR
jgi:hypothetical protein